MWVSVKSSLLLSSRSTSRSTFPRLNCIDSSPGELFQHRDSLQRSSNRISLDRSWLCLYIFAMGNKTLPPGSEAVPVTAATITAFSWTTVPYLVSGFVFYVFVCNVLRFRRRDTMHRKYYYPDRKSLGSMTNVDAQQITMYLAELEFPKLYYTSVQFALFKVCFYHEISNCRRSKAGTSDEDGWQADLVK